jgi:hypothetical protein
LVRERVTEDDLSLFYERAAALASISSQGKQLNSLLVQVEELVQEMQQPELLNLVGVIRTELSQAQTVLAEKSVSLEQLDELEERSGIAAISRRVTEISSRTQGLNAVGNQKLEAELLNTRLSGLLTQLEHSIFQSEQTSNQESQIWNGRSFTYRKSNRGDRG